ncbi:MAG: hypothetical protein AB8B79_16335 [Granulosicoccus sp.]
MEALPAHQNKRNCQIVTACLVVVLCLVPLLWPIFATLHAADVTPTLVNDADGDLIVDTADVDDDNDGIPDLHEIAVDGSDLDSDGDGIPNRLDLDSDNDSILDWLESGAIKTLDLSSLRKLGPRLVGEVGFNGLLDVFEAPLDTGRLRYTLANTDVNEDDIPDYLDLDSDNDGWSDFNESRVSAAYDQDGDARIDAPPGSVGADGIADYLQQINDRACCDLDGDGIDDISPINSDMADLPDYQDLDSDNDGIKDIVELNGIDANDDGHVDNFVDSPTSPDGMDDGLLIFPYTTSDANGNGVPDHADFFASNVVPGTTAPIPSEQLQDPVEQGVVLTGLDASGCSVASAASDFLLLLMSILSIAVLAWRNTLRHVASKNRE